MYLSHGPVQPGTLCTARVVSATEYDLLAEVQTSVEAASDATSQLPQRGKSKAVERRRGVIALRTIS